MIYLDQKDSILSTLIENQFPEFVQEKNPRFINFVTGYYQSQELKFKPLDIATNLTEYYNISYFKENNLIEKTKLNMPSNLSKDATVITVDSTNGFPEKNGYIKIDDEIIFYRTSTKTTFIDCVRGTSALVLDRGVTTDIVLTPSSTDEHLDHSDVVNIAYSYANEFFSRIKSELAPLLPEILVSDIDIASFISKIKSFYSSKGSLNSHRILFRILFNDRRFNIILKKRGFGAKLKINNTRGKVDSSPAPEIVSGGVNYDNRTINGKLINTPIVDIIGSGTGVVSSSGIRENTSAIIEIDDINSDGVITSIKVVDEGENYRGPINTVVRNRKFLEDHIVYNELKTGSGRVEYYDSFTDELILYDVIGYFAPNDELFTDDGEKARAFIAKSYTSPVASRNGFQVDGENQNIEFPRNYTFSPSSASSISPIITKFKYLTGNLEGGFLPQVITLVQDGDKKYKIPGATIGIDNSFSLENNVYQVDISRETDLNNIYLQPETVVIKEQTMVINSTDFIVSVDDASRFPLENGVIFVDGVEIYYKTRTMKQFFGCQYPEINGIQISNKTLDVGSEVVSYGRMETLNKWNSNETITRGDLRYNGISLYRALNSATSGTNAPTHTFGNAYDGTIVNADPVNWQYVAKNRYNYSFYIKNNDNNINDPSFRLLGVPSKLSIDDGGALNFESTYRFVDDTDKNISTFNQSDFETSDIFTTIFPIPQINYVDDSRFINTYHHTTGIQSKHEFGDHIYVSSTAIPPWWSDIVTTSGNLFNIQKEPIGNNGKLVDFTNQNSVYRINKRSLNPGGANFVGSGRKNKKSIGLDVNGIQINSYRGNTVEYGGISKLVIADGGIYPVPIQIYGNVARYDAWLNGMPRFQIRSEKDGSIINKNTNSILAIAASIKKINFTKLYNEYKTELTGFTSKPSIELINDSNFITQRFNLNQTKLNGNLISIDINDVEKLESGDRVLFEYSTNLKSFDNLVDNTYYHISVEDTTTDFIKIKLHITKSDALLAKDPIELSLSAGYSNVSFNLVVDPLLHPNHRDAVLDISYADGNIDNIVVLDEGFGYVGLPSIYIKGGGKTSNFKIPYGKGVDRYIEVEGPLVSKNNFYKSNFNEIEDFITSTSYDSRPSITVDFGSNAEAVAYVSDGEISSISLSNIGSEYSVPPIVVVGDGGTTTARLESILDFVNNGKAGLKEIKILDGGEGYTSSPRLFVNSAEKVKAVISVKLKEWTFNLPSIMSRLDRVDDYGGYVLNSNDIVPTGTNNKAYLKVVDQNLDFPKTIDSKEYYILSFTDKLVAYDIHQRNSKIRSLYSSPSLNVNAILNADYHSPIVGFSYDGIPIYASNKLYSDPRTESTLQKVSSRYKLKYSTSQPSTSNKLSVTISGTTYWVSREGGPSISDYPIGTFIDDYEYSYSNTLGVLDRFNGRFSVTPEFPDGKYYYVSTNSSFDNVTNSLLTNTAAGNTSSASIPGGFPFVVGDEFASVYDDYNNNKCRTSDRIPRVFERINEGSQLSSDQLNYSGYDANDYYPSEDKSRTKSIVSQSNSNSQFDNNSALSSSFGRRSLTSGSVDSYIIENAGDGYKVGDRLIIDNNLSSGSGASAFVSRVGGRNIEDIKIIVNTDNKLVEFTTNVGHGLSHDDYVFFKYKDINESLLGDGYFNEQIDLSSAGKFDPQFVAITTSNLSGINLKTININAYTIYKISGDDIELYADLEKKQPLFELVELKTNYVIIDPRKLPDTFFIKSSSISTVFIFQKTRDYFGKYRVFKYVSPTKFIIEFNESVEEYYKNRLEYSAKSVGASGPIFDITISSNGSGYRRLPTISSVIKKGTDELDNQTAGNGKAIIQLDSTSIGKLKNFNYSSVSSFTSNLNVRHKLRTPITAKVVNNFEIDSVEVITGGSFYDNVVILLVNGDKDQGKLKATVSVGTITKVEVIDGGSNFSEVPTISVSSQEGTGASFKVKIKRKNLLSNAPITTDRVSKKYPVEISGNVTGFDPFSSTIQIEETSGFFINNDIIKTTDGKIYGKLVSIKRSKVSTVVESKVALSRKITDTRGNVSDYSQRITDSNYYQNWSYSIVSSRDTSEWKKIQDINTHPAGFKQFGKKVIERRKKFFSDQVFKSSVIFTAAISSDIELNVKLSPCFQRRILLQDTSLYSVGDYIYGTISGAIGQIVKVTDYFIYVDLRNKEEFILQEIIVKITQDFAFNNFDSTDLSLSFFSGIYQEHDTSFEVAASTSSNEYYFVPNFDFLSTDEIYLYRISPKYDTADPPNITNNFDVLDTSTISANSNSISFTKNNITYNITSGTLQQFIISVAGIIQNPNLLTVSNNAVGLGTTIGFDNTKVCAVRHDNLRKLSFTNPQTNNTVFTLNYTPTHDCNLLIFYSGLFQTQLVPAQDFTISGNQITFETSIDPSLVFGWYIQNETVTCESINTSLLNENRVQTILHCKSANPKQQLIESNAVKNPQSFYEARNEIIDGTVYPVSSTRVEGFDTKFSYTSPRYSSSYVEVLDKLSFNGSKTNFEIQRDGKNYTPSNGEESLVVYIDNQVLDYDQYSVSGSNLYFSTAYTSSVNCTLIDYVSEFLSNTNNENGTIIDRLGVVQNGTRNTFNLSDRGVPKYVNNVGDIFVIKNDKLQYPVSSYTDHKYRSFNGHTVNDNKISFVDAPEASDDINLAFFNRQLSPLSTKNVVLDPFVCFDDSRTTFPITIGGILQSGFVTNNFFVVRNGVLQKPSIDYTISGQNIIFSDAPSPNEDGQIFAFYAYDGLNQNGTLNFANYVNGSQTDFALTVNYTNATVDNDVNILVIRNGVIQEVGVDYSIQDNNTFPFIRFTTAPQQTEDIFMLNITDSGNSNLVNITSTLSQSNSTTITATADVTASNKFLVFNNGILQTRLSGSYSVNVPSGSGSKTFTFTFSEDVDISDLYIIAFADQTTMGQEYDVLNVSDTSILTYDLKFSGNVTDALSDANEIIVAIDGVVQKAGFSYTVSPYVVNSVTDRIIFNSTALTSVGAEITVIRIGDDISGTPNPVQYLDFIDDNYDKVTKTENGISILPTRYKLVYTDGNGFQSFNPTISDPADILIIRAGVVQNPTQDYLIGPGYIQFTTNVIETEDIYILHTHGRDELTISSNTNISTNQTDYVVSTTISSSDEDRIIIYADGIPRFKRRGDFTVYNNNTIRLTHSDGFIPTQVFVVKYPNVQLIDDFEYCPNGQRTVFKMFYNQTNLIAGDILSDADILAVKNGIVLDPSTEYDISTNRGLITFTDAPDHNDTIMMIRMSENTAITLVDDPNSNNTKRYKFGNSYSESSERENVVIFSNNKWRFAELGHFTWNNNDTITLSQNHTSGTLFAIKFFGVFNLLDQINTPFNGSITRFNLFDGEENFVPIGTTSNDNTPDPTSILVVKNGNVLEPGHDFDIEPITDNETQIVFTTAPILSDVISVRSVGSFDKLDTKTSSSGTVFELKKGGTTYYPNHDIDRPRKLENQILVVKDGEVQSPLYDYYIDNEKIRFISSVSFSRLFIMDFRGTYSDVRVFNRINEVKTGDKIQIPGEETERTITSVLSPTVLNTESYSGDGPSGFAASAIYSSGGITGFTVTNKGGGYDTPVVIRTKGTGTGAKATALVETIYGNRVQESSIDLQYSGYNIYTNPIVVATQYASVYKLQPLNKSEIRKATKLLQNINNSVESFDVGNATGLPSNPPTITVSSSSGSGAEFKVYVSGGEIRKIDILNGGSGYDDRDFTIEVTGGGGDGCVLEGVLNSSGTITSITIQNPGVGYDTNRIFFYKNNVEPEGVEYTYVIKNSISSIGFDTTNSDGIYEFGNGTAIVNGGTGNGSTGGFDIGTHLRFGDNSGTRFVTFDPIDTRGVNSVRVYAVRGNDSNGGETPDVVGDEDLRIQYQSTASGVTPDNNSWVDLGIVIDAVPNGSGTGALDNYDFNLPTAVQGEHVYFRLIQDDNSGSDYDHYGILNISFLGYPTYTLDGCTRGAVGTATSHPISDLVYFDSYL